MKNWQEMERDYCLRVLSIYWPRGDQFIRDIRVSSVGKREVNGFPPEVEMVPLPKWAVDVGINGGLLAPTACIIKGEEPKWSRTDWWRTIFWYLNGVAERSYEESCGCIHSYSYRLKGWDERLWQYAWVNRIALFLRRWASREYGDRESSLFGPLPKGEIVITHDIDAITKTTAIRIKQSAFQCFNAIRSCIKGKPLYGLKGMYQASQFFFGAGDYWCFDKIIEMEIRYGFRSCFYVYGGPGGWRRNPKQLLFDPAYTVEDLRVKNELRKLSDGGWEIGLHPSFNAWREPALLAKERWHVENSLEIRITACRQHWLRFSWLHSWKNQQQAGFLFDSTLGFNDHPGFRNGAALRFVPWDFDGMKSMNLEVLPLILMDSHLYNYSELTESERQTEIAHWINEVRSVGGSAAILWHPHVFASDYNWGSGFETVLSMS